jgi:hypothetical protein
MNKVTVHGSIFFLLRKFITNRFPAGSWELFIEQGGIPHQEFELTEAYGIEEIGAIMAQASTSSGIPIESLKEQFGEYLVPDLFVLYAHYLKPAWKTYDVLLYTETVMHGAVRKLNSTANPPILNVSKISKNLIMIDYFSKRRLGSLAVGIIKGIAKYYGEDAYVQVEPTTAPDAERVQIKVHFRKPQSDPAA